MHFVHLLQSPGHICASASALPLSLRTTYAGKIIFAEIFRVVVYYLIVKFLFCFAVSRDSFYRLPQLFYFVNHFFLFFSICIFQLDFQRSSFFDSHHIISSLSHYVNTIFPQVSHILSTFMPNTVDNLGFPLLFHAFYL